MIVRLRDERGLTLVEILVAMVISLILLGATLSVSVALTDSARRTADHNDAQDTARTYLDRLSRQLRNLASPTIFTEDYQALPNAIDVASPDDLVFRVVDEVRQGGSLNLANVKRVRFCLDSADPERGRLYREEQTWKNRASNDPPPMPSVATCPARGEWTTTTLVTEHVTNQSGGQDRPVFVFNSADRQQISQIHAELYVDPDPTRAPGETRLASGVTLRNQNRVPVAQIDAAPSAGAVVLNGSGSHDPEARPLTYVWYVDPSIDVPLPDCEASPRPASCLGGGIVIEAQLSPGLHRIVLLVKDPAGLPDTEEIQVTIP